MYQKIIIIGNLGNDPEMRYMPNGTAVTGFSVATNRKWTDQQSGQPVEEVTWFRVSVWGRQAEAANQYLAKGRQVMIEGRLKPDSQTGGPRLWSRQDGSMAASFEIQADQVKFLSGGGSDDGGNAPSGSRTAANPIPAEEDDIPF